MDKIIKKTLLWTYKIVVKICKDKINKVITNNQESITILNSYLLKFYNKINMKIMDNRRIMNIRISTIAIRIWISILSNSICILIAQPYMKEEMTINIFMSQMDLILLMNKIRIFIIHQILILKFSKHHILNKEEIIKHLKISN